MLEHPNVESRAISSENQKHMQGIIYKITNPKNGKAYIGQTTRKLRRRKERHLCRFNKGDRDHKIYLAMKKYGFENFEWEKLEENILFMVLDIGLTIGKKTNCITII